MATELVNPTSTATNPTVKADRLRSRKKGMRDCAARKSANRRFQDAEKRMPLLCHPAICVTMALEVPSSWSSVSKRETAESCIPLTLHAACAPRLAQAKKCEHYADDDNQTDNINDRIHESSPKVELSFMV